MYTKLSPLIGLLLSTLTNSAIAQANAPESWKFQNDQDNKCVAKYASFKGIELATNKLTITTKETSDLKAFEVSVNDKVVSPMGRANLTDTSCKCIRIRNTEVLNAENATIYIRGQNSMNVPVETSISLQQIGAAVQALNSNICNKTQK